MEEDEADSRMTMARVLHAVEMLSIASPSRWRVPRDAVDLVRDALVDRYLANTPPERPLAWARTVLTNHAKRGPRRVGLDRKTCVGGDAIDMLLAIAERRDDDVQLERLWNRLPGIWNQFLSVLSPSEQVAVKTITTGSRTVAEAALECGWSRRDVRVRLNRARKKLARLLDGRADETR